MSTPVVTVSVITIVANNAISVPSVILPYPTQFYATTGESSFAISTPVVSVSVITIAAKTAMIFSSVYVNVFRVCLSCLYYTSQISKKKVCKLLRNH